MTEVNELINALHLTLLCSWICIYEGVNRVVVISDRDESEDWHVHEIQGRSSGSDDDR